MGISSIHYDPNRKDYSLTPGELDQAEKGSGTYSKEFCLVGLSMGIPCVINGLTELDFDAESITITPSLFLNTLVGIVAIGFFITNAFKWRRDHVNRKTLFDGIKNKPVMNIVEMTTGSASFLELNQSPTLGYQHFTIQQSTDSSELVDKDTVEDSNTNRSEESKSD